MSLKKNTAPVEPAKPVKKKAEKPEVILVEKSEFVRVNRKDLARIICDKVRATGKALPPSIADIMVSAYEEAIIEELAKRHEVNLPGFGKFYTVDKEASFKRNPATGGAVEVEAYTAVKFKLGASLKSAARG